jgi:dipeptidyl aminopeptidase/acylaminoacyl peptidase
MPLPLNRLYLSQTISEPSFGATPDVLFYAKQADGRRSIMRMSLETGLAQPVTTEPPPSGGVSYGGGQYAVQGEVLVYAGRGGRLHGVDLGTGRQWTVSPPYEGVAAPAFTPDGRFVAFLAEQDGHCNVLLADTRGEHLPVKLSRDPWYAFNPVVSLDGRAIAWMEWDDYRMPWDESRIVVAAMPKPAAEWSQPAEALPPETRRLSKSGVSFSSPQFSPNSQYLAYCSDESGWRSLWVTPIGASDLQAAAERLDLGPGEVGGPDWVPGQAKLRWAADGRALYAIRRHQSRGHLIRVSWPDKAVTEIETGWTWLTDLNLCGERLALLAERPTHPMVVLTVDTRTGQIAPRATSAVGLTGPDDVVEASLVAWPAESGVAVSGVFYHAQPGPGREGPRPLLVVVHGGPTSERGLGWEAQAQYFATRGWHVVLVNHRGGSGFGRAFQDLLNGQWGVVDVQDARGAAEHLVAAGLADPTRLVITGASAGGYTTLMALTQAPDFWAAGVSSAGIGQMYDIVAASHRFEVHYEWTLIGPLPEAGPLWKERSPLTHVRQVRAPVLLFHGRKDNVVAAQQSIEFAEAVKRQGGVAELVLYDEEGHVFAREATRRDQIERMERFLDKYVLCRQ